jgi:hypothetical protein
MLTPTVKIEIAIRKTLRNIKMCLVFMPVSSIAHRYPFASLTRRPASADSRPFE